MAFDYTNLNQCIGRVATLTETTGKEAEISYKLQDTAAIKEGASDVYRPIYVAAIIAEQDLDSQTLSEANKVKFTGLSKPIESWLREAYGQDLRLVADGYIIPLGTLAIDKLNAIYEVNGASGAIGPIMSAFTA